MTYPKLSIPFQVVSCCAKLLTNSKQLNSCSIQSLPVTNMAKKKGNNKSNATSVETIPRSSSDDAASPPQSSTTEQEQKPVEALSVEELRMELLAARAELAKAKGQTAGKVTQPQDVQELHVKLQQLRKEQQEADAARDKAWSQLKVRSAAQG